MRTKRFKDVVKYAMVGVLDINRFIPSASSRFLSDIFVVRRL